MFSRKSLEQIPSKPGVYLLKDSQERVLYVGKAINLKKRLASYSSKKGFDLKKNNLINQAKKIDYLLANGEIESLLLEAKLIKTYQPKYNNRAKDSTRYLYVGITKEEYPQVVLLRYPEKEENLLEWFGPFPTAGSLKEILRLVRRIFPYRTCRAFPKRKCLFYHLGLCACYRPKKEYLRNVSHLRMFLGGKIAPLIKRLKMMMKEAGRKEEYEKAAVYKDQIEKIQSVLRGHSQFPEGEKIARQLKQLRRLLVRYQGIDPVVIKRLEAYDIANLGKDIVVGSMVAFIDGEPDPASYRRFRVAACLNDPAGLMEIVGRRLHHQEWVYPQVILLDGGKVQVAAGFAALKEFGIDGQISLIGLAKKEEKIIIPKIEKGIIRKWHILSPRPSSLPLQLLQYARDEAHRFAQRYYRKLHQKALMFLG